MEVSDPLHGPGHLTRAERVYDTNSYMRLNGPKSPTCAPGGSRTQLPFHLDKKIELSLSIHKVLNKILNFIKGSL
jgi:hypothetical protein